MLVPIDSSSDPVPETRVATWQQLHNAMSNHRLLDLKAWDVQKCHTIDLSELVLGRYSNWAPRPFGPLATCRGRGAVPVERKLHLGPRNIRFAAAMTLPAFEPVPGLAFHHIGVACRSLDTEERHYQSLGYRREGADFTDPIQGIQGRFLAGGGPRLELLVETPGKSVLTPWLKKGIRLYHLAWEAADLDQASRQFVEQRARVVVPPVPAVAFEGRSITFLMLPNLQLIELIQVRRPA